MAGNIEAIARWSNWRKDRRGKVETFALLVGMEAILARLLFDLDFEAAVVAHVGENQPCFPVSVHTQKDV